jgi:N-acetylmuramic acid 6-phosphate etherase
MPIYLAFEGGATRTLAGRYTASGALVSESKGPGTNPTAYGLDAVSRTLRTLGKELLDNCPEKPVVLCGLAGARTEEQRTALGQSLCQALNAKRVTITSDLHPLLAANAHNRPAILAVAGTGSCVLAQDQDGHHHKVGGWGTILGDEGSAYHLARRAIRAALKAHDHLGVQTKLSKALPKAAGLSTIENFVVWSATASKADIAALAKTVTTVADANDTVAKACVDAEASALASQIHAAEAHLSDPQSIPLFVHGGLFDNHPPYRAALEAALNAEDARAVIEPVMCKGHRAIFNLTKLRTTPDWLTVVSQDTTLSPPLPATEQRLNLPTTIDKLTAPEIVSRMNEADSTLPAVVATQQNALAAAIGAAAESLQQDGRVFYIGAGTSGRLGALDAAECPPTFGVTPDRIVGIMAGGDKALRESVEGAEDDPDQGAKDLQAHHPTPQDTVVGIAASGTTPYVLGALEAAESIGATTILLTCNPAATTTAKITIALDTGPEVLAGSTRLKAGTATKLALNIISTGALSRAGYIYDGLMIGMAPTNRKLRDRATRIVAELTSKDINAAQDLLATAHDHIALAVLMGKKNLDLAQAEKALLRNGGNLHRALTEADDNSTTESDDSA